MFKLRTRNFGNGDSDRNEHLLWKYLNLLFISDLLRLEIHTEKNTEYSLYFGTNKFENKWVFIEIFSKMLWTESVRKAEQMKRADSNGSQRTSNKSSFYITFWAYYNLIFTHLLEIGISIEVT